MNIPFQQWQVPLLKEYLKSRDIYFPSRALKADLVLLANQVQNQETLSHRANSLEAYGELNPLLYFILLNDLKMIKRTLRHEPHLLNRINNYGYEPLDLAEEVANENILRYLTYKSKK